MLRQEILTSVCINYFWNLLNTIKYFVQHIVIRLNSIHCYKFPEPENVQNPVIINSLHIMLFIPTVTPQSTTYLTAPWTIKLNPLHSLPLLANLYSIRFVYYRNLPSENTITYISYPTLTSYRTLGYVHYRNLLRYI